MEGDTGEREEGDGGDEGKGILLMDFIYMYETEQ
jgi:hypothetical protein